MDKLIGTSPLLLIYRHHYDILIKTFVNRNGLKNISKKETISS